jgi:ribosome-associated protein
MSADGGDVAGDLTVNGRLVIPAAELQWRFSRSSGPGGQSVNTTDSRVELVWDAAASAVLSRTQRDRALAQRPTGLFVVSAAEQRSQWQNRRDARLKLVEAVRTAVATPPPSRRPTRPSRGSVERRLAGKKRRSEVKRQRRMLDD